jgi:hypothetical protein
VYVDARRIATRKVRSFSVKVSTKKLHKGKHHLTVRVRDKSGRNAHKTVAFRVC